jgi:hypothetical protein
MYVPLSGAPRPLRATAPPAQNASFVHNLFLCLSRACLGKKIVFSIKLAPQKRRFSHRDAGRREQVIHVEQHPRPVTLLGAVVATRPCCRLASSLPWHHRSSLLARRPSRRRLRSRGGDGRRATTSTRATCRFGSGSCWIGGIPTLWLAVRRAEERRRLGEQELDSGIQHGCRGWLDGGAGWLAAGSADDGQA